MVTLLANNLKDWQRKFKSSQKRDVRRERRLGDADSQRGPLAASLAAADSGPPSRLLKQESEDLVAQALAQLPRGYQTIIIWRSEQRLSWREIAQRLDRSEDAVRMLWKRALERLKRQVREHP